MIIPKHSTEPPMADNFAVGIGGHLSGQKPVSQPLMIAFEMIVSDVLPDCMTKLGLAEEDHAIETL